MSNKHIPKEELNEDTLVTIYARFVAYITYHYKIAIGIGVAILLVIGSVIGLYYYNQSQNHKAEVLMVDAQNYFRQSDFKKALDGDQQAITLGFSQIANKYSGTTAGNLAQYYAAICELNLGDNTKALSYIENYKIPEGILGVGPISLKGVILSNLGEYQKSAQAYIKAANWDKNNSTTPYNLLSAARSYMKAGQLADAQKLVGEVIDKYPETQYMTEAEKMNGYLSASAMK